MWKCLERCRSISDEQSSHCWIATDLRQLTNHVVDLVLRYLNRFHHLLSLWHLPRNHHGGYSPPCLRDFSVDGNKHTASSFRESPLVDRVCDHVLHSFRSVFTKSFLELHDCWDARVKLRMRVDECFSSVSLLICHLNTLLMRHPPDTSQSATSNAVPVSLRSYFSMISSKRPFSPTRDVSTSSSDSSSSAVELQLQAIGHDIACHVQFCTVCFHEQRLVGLRRSRTSTVRNTLPEVLFIVGLTICRRCTR